MEENNISIDNKGLEAISAGGARSFGDYIDFKLMSFEDFLTKNPLPDEVSPEGHDAFIYAVENAFTSFQKQYLSLLYEATHS